ncbi:MAG: hypothetical protein AAF355_00130 [Myxococcota bacterium]
MNTVVSILEAVEALASQDPAALTFEQFDALVTQREVLVTQLAKAIRQTPPETPEVQDRVLALVTQGTHLQQVANLRIEEIQAALHKVQQGRQMLRGYRPGRGERLRGAVRNSA